MKYPKNIQQGGTIGFVAPSFGCQIEPYYSAFGNAQKSSVNWDINYSLVPTVTRKKASASAIRPKNADRS